MNLQHDVFLTTGEFEPRSSSPSQLADRHRPGVVSSSGMSVVLLCYTYVCSSFIFMLNFWSSLDDLISPLNLKEHIFTLLFLIHLTLVWKDFFCFVFKF